MLGLFETLGLGEILIILAAVLLLFGAKRLPEIARSLEVYSATTFSTVAGCPSSSSKLSSWATNPGSSASRRSASTVRPSLRTLVRAARATRTCDWRVSTCRSIVSASTWA